MRHSLIIRPDPAASAEIDRWRARFDAHYKLIGPHLTVAFPSELRTSIDETKKHLSSTASRLRPFEISFSRWVSSTELLKSHPEQTRFLTERYPNAVNLIALLVKNGAAESLELRQACSEVIPQPDLTLTFPPYVALGQTLSTPAFEAAKIELADYQPKAQFSAVEFELLAEKPNGSWIVADTFRLGPRRQSL